ncbi:leucyl aminopeptidase [Pedococcus bigeumensis]|uniref:Probable cytosol aminopeptidase n=1 Tax=Pedococcus bigeumensis TaxID=433644 RepID=A0A502D2U2_9MICO|nr:leucyl aminopeptidase [Pedococcus bigeumensis]TPG18341.1 leucyl aminopeptidase [Pedococcus bigeumensis]
MTTVNVSDRPAHDLKADVLVLATVDTDGKAALAAGHGLPRGAATHVAAQLAALHATGAAEEVLTIAAVPGVAAARVVLTGLGKASARTTAFDHEVLRRGAGAASRSLKNATRIVVALPTTGAESVAAVAEGAALGAYRYAGVRGPSAQPTKGVTTVTVATSDARVKAVKAAATRAGILADAKAYARDLVNTPPNQLFPQSFADSVKARNAAATAKVTIKVLDEKALEKGGFGGIVGVGQGSVNPPRMVTLTWNPPRAKASVALVGKGITFDSGGLNLKPAASMLGMKSDMAGAAAVAATVFAAAELGLPVKVTGYLCLAENMPSGTAQRPSDVVTMRNGTTVEILDTDAEGRMVLGDGICLAGEAKPDAIVDIATLTGAQMVALGARVAGIMANEDTFRDRVGTAAASAGESAWPMPLPTDLRSQLDSSVADLAHKGERWGGMLTAGLFLREFVTEGTPWAHVDIAGPSYNEGSPWGYTPKGGTGFGVGTLLALVEGYAG